MKHLLIITILALELQIEHMRMNDRVTKIIKKICNFNAGIIKTLSVHDYIE